MKIDAFIPIRAGSKGIPDKNIREFCGKPLCFWTIVAAAQCEDIRNVYVSTESSRYRTIVESFEIPKVIVVDRSLDTCTDTASTESALLEISPKLDSDVVALLQATSPLTTSLDLTSAIEMFRSQNFDSLLSGVKQHRFRWEPSGDGGFTPLNYQPGERPRRQDWVGEFYENGSFYIFKREQFLETKSRLFGRIGLFVQDDETAFEIDSPSDWKILEGIMADRRALCPRMESIKLFISDVDGVLTDGGMYYSENGDELKRFNTRDGMGFELLRKAGVTTAIVTSENVALNERRAKKLAVDFLFQGVRNKVDCVENLLRQLDLKWSQVAYVGDDINDEACLKKAGWSFAPRDAVSTNLRIVDTVCVSSGGRGCVREAAEEVLKSNARVRS